MSQVKFIIELLGRKITYKVYLNLLGVLCAFCFLIGLLFATGAGEYWLKVFDAFAGTIGLVVVALLEMIAVVYVYGHKK